MPREAIKKKIRFEVYKRDKFTCQYCGRKAPDVILNIDHIDPVAHGGSNDIINLITSCFDCNNGKRNIKLSDNSVIEKQRKQLEVLQERREQIELMFEWKKSLQEFDSESSEMIARYINSKIHPLSISDSAKNVITDWLKKFPLDKILDGIDESAKAYLRYENNEITEESANKFFTKIPGVIVVKGKPPIDQKLAYIKGIAKNRFQYWSNRNGSIILNNYVNALRQQKWSDEDILEDLESEVIRISKESKNWTEWRNILEKWTQDILNWESPPTKEAQREHLYSSRDITVDTLDRASYHIKCELEDHVNALIHIGSAFPDFNVEKFTTESSQAILLFLNQLEEEYNSCPESELDEDPDYVPKFVSNCGLTLHFDIRDNSTNFGVLYVLSEKCFDLIADLFSNLYLPKTLYKRSDINILLKLLKQQCSMQPAI